MVCTAKATYPILTLQFDNSFCLVFEKSDCHRFVIEQGSKIIMLQVNTDISTFYPLKQSCQLASDPYMSQTNR